MSKGKVKNPKKGQGSSKRAIGTAIIQEWIDIVANPREMDVQALSAAIGNQLDPIGPGPNDRLEVGIIADPVHQETNQSGGRVKFIWICIPAPELGVPGWLVNNGYAKDVNGSLVPDEGGADELGEAVLFGCGR